MKHKRRHKQQNCNLLFVAICIKIDYNEYVNVEKGGFYGKSFFRNAFQNEIYRTVGTYA